MRAARATPRLPVAAMHRTRSPARPLALARTLAPTLVAALVTALVAALAACDRPPEGSVTTPQSSPPAPPAAPSRTANNDARGAGVQPDYAGEAALLREQILPRLPASLPGDRRAACTAMLDAAAAFYGDIEGEAGPRATLLADIQATRAADLAACERETSVRAATCVQLRLADRDAELPWLIDQCTRAFPD